MTSIGYKLDTRDIQDILTQVYEKSLSNQTLDAQEVIKEMVSHLQEVFQEKRGS